MEKINVKPLIKEDKQWTIENSESSLQATKDKYLNKFVTDGEDILHVTAIKFTPTGINKGHYLVDLVDDEPEASSFLKL